MRTASFSKISKLNRILFHTSNEDCPTHWDRPLRTLCVGEDQATIDTAWCVGGTEQKQARLKDFSQECWPVGSQCLPLVGKHKHTRDGGIILVPELFAKERESNTGKGKKRHGCEVQVDKDLAQALFELSPLP